MRVLVCLCQLNDYEGRLCYVPELGPLICFAAQKDRITRTASDLKIRKDSPALAAPAVIEHFLSCLIIKVRLENSRGSTVVQIPVGTRS